VSPDQTAVGDQEDVEAGGHQEGDDEEAARLSPLCFGSASVRRRVGGNDVI
jgi:hypothetical protein